MHVHSYHIQAAHIRIASRRRHIVPTHFRQDLQNSSHDGDDEGRGDYQDEDREDDNDAEADEDRDGDGG